MNNKRKTLWCRIFGCHVPTGYGKYFRVELGAVDGIGRHHARIIGKCERCDSNVTIGNFHTHADGHLYGSKELFSHKINLKHIKAHSALKSEFANRHSQYPISQIPDESEIHNTLEQIKIEKFLKDEEKSGPIIDERILRKNSDPTDTTNS